MGPVSQLIATRALCLISSGHFFGCKLSTMGSMSDSWIQLWSTLGDVVGPLEMAQLEEVGTRGRAVCSFDCFLSCLCFLVHRDGRKQYHPCQQPHPAVMDLLKQTQILPPFCCFLPGIGLQQREK